MLLKLIFLNAFRHKLRTLLTICGICVAILAFGMLRTLVSAWYAGVEASAANRLVSRNAISLVFSLPLSYREKMRSVEGVKNVSFGNWFGGVYIDEKNFFANFAVEPKSYLEMYPEYMLPVDQKEAFLRDRKAFVAGRKLAARFGWKLGDTITLKGTIFPGDWEFVLRGIYTGRDKTIDESQFFFHWNYLNESLKKNNTRRADQVGFYIITIENAAAAARTAEELDAQFKNSFAETLTETEKAFQMSFVSLSEAIISAIRLISLVVIVIILAVVANTMIMSVRERTGEYAVLKTLGFGGSFIAVLILGESLVISMLGGALGIVLTFPAAQIIGQAVGDWIPVFNVAPETIYMDIGAAVLVGLSAAVFPIWRATTIRIAEGLRRIG
jgi:putative ABC transport system permease protein